MNKSSNFCPDWEFFDKKGFSKERFLRCVTKAQKGQRFKKREIKTEIRNSCMQTIEKKDSPRRQHFFYTGIEDTLYSEHIEEFIYIIEKNNSESNTVSIFSISHHDLKNADIHDICVLRGCQLWLAEQKGFREGQEVWVQEKKECKQYKIFCFTEAESIMLKCAIRAYLEQEIRIQKSIKKFDLSEVYLLVLKEKIHDLISHLDYLTQLEILTQLETLLVDIRLLKQHYDQGGYVSKSFTDFYGRFTDFKILIINILAGLDTR